jgi:hypothetical protein
MHDKLRVLAKGKLGSITTKLTPSMHKGPPGIQPGTVEFKVLNLKGMDEDSDDDNWTLFCFCFFFIYFLDAKSFFLGHFC